MPVTHGFVSAVADGTTSGEVLTQTHWNAGLISTVSNSSLVFPEVLARSVSITSSNTSAVSTALSYVIPARVMSSNRMLRFRMHARALVATTAVANNFRWEVIHNSSRWADTVSTMPAALTTPMGIQMEVYVAAINSSATRKLWGRYIQSSNTAPSFGLGDITGVQAAALRHINVFGSSATYTVTTGAASTFAVQFNWLAANSSLSLTVDYSYLELL